MHLSRYASINFLYSQQTNKKNTEYNIRNKIFIDEKKLNGSIKKKTFLSATPAAVLRERKNCCWEQNL